MENYGVQPDIFVENSPEESELVNRCVGEIHQFTPGIEELAC
jgi:hypothetical protein